MARVMLGCFVLFSALAGAMEGRSSRRRRPLGFLFRKEEPWLFEFSGYGSAYVKKYMADTVKMIEKKYKTKLHTFDVYKDPAAYKFWLLIIRDPLTGKEMTKGLPLYYNRKTGGIVSGMTTVDNFDKWAGGSGDHDVDCPPLMYVPPSLVAALAWKRLTWSLRSTQLGQRSPDDQPHHRKVRSHAALRRAVRQGRRHRRRRTRHAPRRTQDGTRHRRTQGPARLTNEQTTGDLRLPSSVPVDAAPLGFSGVQCLDAGNFLFPSRRITCRALRIAVSFRR